MSSRAESNPVLETLAGLKNSAATHMVAGEPTDPYRLYFLLSSH